MAWLADAAAYLAANMTGTHAVGTDVFTTAFPECPDTAICLYDAGGSLTPHGPDTPWAEHRLEVRARAATDAAAQTLMGLVTTAIHAKTGQTWNTTTAVRWVRLDAPPTYLKLDQKRRYVWIARFVLQTGEASYRSS